MLFFRLLWTFRFAVIFILSVLSRWIYNLFGLCLDNLDHIGQIRNYDIRIFLHLILFFIIFNDIVTTHRFLPVSIYSQGKLKMGTYKYRVRMGIDFHLWGWG